jgi:hypothetical protein
MQTTYAGMTVNELMNKLSQLTSRKDAALVTGHWLVETGTRIARTFNYKAAFPKTDQGCAPKFARSLAHQDWKDGHDLVQAEQTATEDGFNLRFHRIENDLDALNGDTKTLFNCLSSMRSNLADRLDDIKTELNLIDADIARLQACCDEHSGYATLDPSTFPKEPPPFQLAGPFIGGTHWFGKPMLAFKTSQGIYLVPKVSPVDGPGDPRVQNVMDLAKAFATDKRLARAFGDDPVSKKELVEKYGDVPIGDDRTLADALDIVPDTSSFKSADTLLKAVAEREAAAIRTGGEADALLTSALGFEEVTSVASTSLERYEAIPEPARAALLSIGVETMGALAQQSGPELAKALQQEGFAADESEVTGWVAAAGVMGMVR